MISLNTLLLIFTLTGITVAIAILALMLHKVRRIHLATYAIQSDAHTSRREGVALFSQLQALHSLERTLSLSKPLPPLRGWAGSPDFLLQLALHILEQKPLTVAECSSGASTLVVARCLQINGVGHVYSLEHDAEFAAKTNAILERHGLSAWATVIVAPLEVGTDGFSWYQENAFPMTMPPIELLVVDGPPGPAAPMARYPALPRLRNRMLVSFTLFLDDANRPDERAIIQKWLAEFPNLKVRYEMCEKGLAIVSLGSNSNDQSQPPV